MNDYMPSNEITKEIRQTLKQEFPSCKFSVTKEVYAGGWSIHVSLMEADFNPMRDPQDVSDWAIEKIHDSYFTREVMEKTQNENYHQLNYYALGDDYDEDNWCNGVFLTEKAHNILQRVTQICQKRNWDNSDAMTDYFDVNYYLHLNIGKWDKPFKVKK